MRAMAGGAFVVLHGLMHALARFDSAAEFLVTAKAHILLRSLHAHGELGFVAIGALLFLVRRVKRELGRDDDQIGCINRYGRRPGSAFVIQTSRRLIRRARNRHAVKKCAQQPLLRLRRATNQEERR